MFFLIVVLRVQLGDNFTHCQSRFTLCCTWHNVPIHTDTLMLVDEAIRIQALFQRWPRRVYEQTIVGLIVEPRIYKGSDGKVENVLKYCMEVLLYVLGGRF